MNFNSITAEQITQLISIASIEIESDYDDNSITSAATTLATAELASDAKLVRCAYERIYQEQDMTTGEIEYIKETGWVVYDKLNNEMYLVKIDVDDTVSIKNIEE